MEKLSTATGIKRYLKLEAGELELFKAKDRTMYEFDWQTWHTAQEAVSHGWRWFGRFISQH